MIINHRYRFIFVKTRKVAGTSLEIALSSFCDSGDVVTPVSREDETIRQKLGYQQPVNWQKKSVFELTRSDLPKLLRLFKRVRVESNRIPARYYNHMTATEIAAQVPKEVWDSYYKFTLCRNPWDRMISAYYWTLQLRPEVGERGFSRFLHERKSNISENWRAYTENGDIIVDEVIKFEDLQSGLSKLSERLSLPEDIGKLMKDIRAKSAVRPSGKDERETISWTREMIELVQREVPEEISLFAYQPPESTV